MPNVDALILDEVLLCRSVGVPAGQHLQAPPTRLHLLQISRYMHPLLNVAIGNSSIADSEVVAEIMYVSGPA